MKKKRATTELGRISRIGEHPSWRNSPDIAPDQATTEGKGKKEYMVTVCYGKYN